MNTATVQCNLNNGLLLTLGVSQWWGGHSLELHEREPVLLRPGANVIDAAYWRAWLSDHADADVVTGRHIYET